MRALLVLPLDSGQLFVDFLVRGLVVPVHEFLRGLLFIYGIQLHQLTPNSLLHISIFITLCECFLGIHPHWCLWKCIFYLRRNNSRTSSTMGSVCICVRPDVDYFDVKFPDSVQVGARRGYTSFCWRGRQLLVTVKHTSVGNPKRKMMTTQVSLSKKPRFIEPVGDEGHVKVVGEGV
ncbi:hypothetical protein QYE76_041106 [Lolium multiflorum]|uniref:Transposase (putative) gypsy type domain-containing protein n=1 Tax=Lolium multiflorum TaxID=4521 RepID=A0AAD8TEN2_LOLMU|nr:hypothetical protein QYE76_041106 [Lolium multiflorum]